MKTGRIVILLLLTACASQPEIKPFQSDGCSLFPDGNFDNRDLWCECCVQHDLAYWRGGTREQRGAADLSFRQCVLEKTGDKTLSELMYQGVKFGGEPYFPNWYRWGYGWNYGRGYQALKDTEEKAVAKRLLEARQDPSRFKCP